MGHLIKKDEKVGASESTLLNMLKISPFSYGLIIQQVYEDGSCFHPSVLDITPEDIMARFIEGIANIASVSLQIGYPNVASVALETEINFPQVEKLKAYLEDPSAFAVSAPVAAAPTETSTEAKEEKKEESEEESDDDMGFGLFD